MLLIRILDELLIIRDKHDEPNHELISRDRFPIVHFIAKNIKQRSMFILNNYRMPGLPTSHFKDLFYHKESTLSKVEEFIKNHADNPFDRKELNNYYIKDVYESDFIGLSLNFGDGLMTSTSIHYNAKENQLVPRQTDDKNFVYGFNDSITRKMGIYTDVYIDRLSIFLESLPENDPDFEEKLKNQIIHHVFSELLYRYNDLVSYKVRNGWRISLSKLGNITAEDYAKLDYNGLFERMDCITVWPKQPEKSYEDLRKEYFEKKALKLLETTKPKRRKKASDKEPNNKTARGTRRTTKSVNDSTQST